MGSLYQVPIQKKELPQGGETGQILTKQADSVEWADLSLPVATTDTLGIVQIGDNLTISDGILSANAVDLSEYAKLEDLADYAPSDNLVDYVRIEAFSNYIPDIYAKTEDLAEYAKLEDLEGFSQNFDLDDYVLKSEANEHDHADYALRSELDNYALVGDLAGLVRIGDLEGYNLEIDLAGYVPYGVLDDYVLKTTFNDHAHLNYAEKSELNGYVSDSELSSALNSYVLKSNASNHTHSNYITTANLAQYALNSALSAYVTHAEFNNHTHSGYALTSALNNYVQTNTLNQRLAAYTPLSQLATVATSGSYQDLAHTPGLATHSVSGLMSSSDKTKLDSLSAGISWVTAPSAPTDYGEQGSVAYDSDYLYICVADNTWKRVALESWGDGVSVYSVTGVVLNCKNDDTKSGSVVTLQGSVANSILNLS